MPVGMPQHVGHVGRRIGKCPAPGGHAGPSLVGRGAADRHGDLEAIVEHRRPTTSARNPGTSRPRRCGRDRRRGESTGNPGLVAYRRPGRPSRACPPPRRRSTGRRRCGSTRIAHVRIVDENEQVALLGHVEDKGTIRPSPSSYSKRPSHPGGSTSDGSGRVTPRAAPRGQRRGVFGPQIHYVLDHHAVLDSRREHFGPHQFPRGQAEDCGQLAADHLPPCRPFARSSGSGGNWAAGQFAHAEIAHSGARRRQWPAGRRRGGCQDREHHEEPVRNNLVKAMRSVARP